MAAYICEYTKNHKIVHFKSAYADKFTFAFVEENRELHKRKRFGISKYGFLVFDLVDVSFTGSLQRKILPV